MLRRVITPHSGFPDRDFLTELENEYQATRHVTPGIYRQKLREKCLQHGTYCVAVLLNVLEFSHFEW